MTKINTHKFFSVPIFEFRLENSDVLNIDLEKYIYDLRSKNPDGIKKSNAGGWHSPNFKITDQNSVQNKFALELQKYILRSFQTLGWKTENKKIVISAMWAIINKKNDFNVLHTHPNAFLSAAYYVSAPKNCGKFFIEHLNMAKRNFYPEVLQNNQLNAQVAGLEVNEGDLLIFPGYLPHKVGMNESDQDRVVISFNVEIK